MLKKCYKNCGDRDRCQELLQKSILKRHDKKIAKTQKAVSEFDKISMQKVNLPLNKDVSILPMQDGDDWNYGDEEFLP